MRIEYTCKFCRQPGSVDCEIEPSIEFQINVWKKLLCCNRCADFMVQKRKLTNLIERVCRVLFVARTTLNQSAITQTESKALEKLTSITKIFSRSVCDYYHKTAVWEPEFPQMILDHPEQFEKILNDYFRMCRTV